MKKVLLFSFALSLFAIASQAQQVVRASMNEDGQVVAEMVENIMLPPQV